MSEVYFLYYPNDCLEEYKTKVELLRRIEDLANNGDIDVGTMQVIIGENYLILQSFELKRIKKEAK